jgi:nitrous oxide reductase accessory protein NosL
MSADPGPKLSPALLGALALLVAVIGCARSAGPVPIRLGTPCASCGMEVQDLRFACERFREREARVYDSIECLLMDNPSPGDVVYLPDYDSRALRPAGSLWIVKGRFPTPMSGGLAAFASRSSADDVASRTEGRVTRWSGAADLLRSAP